jgi:hypothetical protein
VNERLHGQPTETGRDFSGLTEEHDDASRTARRRRAGNRFRYRRRRVVAHNVRTVDDAPFYEYVSAALRCTLVLVCVQIALGTFASGPDTGSDRTSARTAVVQMFYISSSISYSHTSPYGSPADALRSATFAPTAINSNFRRAYATSGCDRPRQASTRSYYQLQSCSDTRSSTHPSWADHLDLQAARQPRPASPITFHLTPAHMFRATATNFSAHLRPTNLPTSPYDRRNHLSRTAPHRHRAVQPLRTAIGMHGLPWSTLQHPTEIVKENGKRKYPIFNRNVSHADTTCGLNVHSTYLCPGGSVWETP